MSEENELQEEKKRFDKAVKVIADLYIGETLKFSVPLRPGVKADIAISGAKWNKKTLLAFSRVVRNMAENFEEQEHPLAEFEQN